MPDEPTRQERIETCLSYIRARPDFPAFSHHIQEVLRALSDDETSFRQLTSLVLRDYSMTLKVLRTANSVQYNRSGRPILSVTHAVALLGVEAIRYVAGGMTVFEHFRRQSPGMKELMLLSLLTANEAREIARLASYPHPEEAYLCGMFRNLGEILIAAYFPKEYAAILYRMEQEKAAETEACLRELQFTYEDLGQAVVRQWSVPEKIARAMERPRTPVKTGDPELDLLKAITAFSHSMTTAVHRREPEGARARLSRLFEEYLPALGLKRQDISEVSEAAIRETKSTFDALRIPLDHLRLRRQMEEALSGERSQSAAEAGPLEGEVRDDADLLQQLAGEIETLLEQPGPVQLHSVLLMILEAILRGGGFDRILFCLMNAEHTHIQGRVALGEGAEELKARFRFPIRAGPVGIALTRRQDVFSGVGLFGTAFYGLLPVIVDGVLVGCLYFDRITERPPLNDRARDLLGRLRDLTGKAICAARHAPPSGMN